MTYKLPGGYTLNNSVNPSLLFEKFLNAKDYDDDSDKKQNLLNGLVKQLNPKMEYFEAYKNKMENLSASLEKSGYKVKSRIYVNTSSLVVGMGRSNMLENGMTFNKNWGIPIIPSSTIKGLIRNYISFYGSNEDKSLIQEYLGSDSDENPSAGKIELLNAYMLYTNTDVYKKDILNNHFKGYYEDDSGNTPPNDWYNPVPVFFMVIKPKKDFVFTLFGLREDAIEKVTQWLDEALSVNGIGGKTSVGYGRFKINVQAMSERQKIQEEKKKEEEIKKLDNMPQLDKQIYILKNSKDVNEKEQTATDLFDKFDKFETQEKIKCANALKEFWESIGKWSVKEVSKKQKEKVNKIKGFLN